MFSTNELEQLLQWNMRTARQEKQAQARQPSQAVSMSIADRAQAIEDKRLARADRELRKAARKAAGKGRSR